MPGPLGLLATTYARLGDQHFNPNRLAALYFAARELAETCSNFVTIKRRVTIIVYMVIWLLISWIGTTS